ncbi:hypothetical protein JCM4914_58140 [Streptomyces platensis subsp. malvinus]
MARIAVLTAGIPAPGPLVMASPYRRGGGAVSVLRHMASGSPVLVLQPHVGFVASALVVAVAGSGLAVSAEV